MDTVAKRLYEGMFLVDSGEAASDWDGVMGTIEKMLGRAESEIVSIKKWDERRLAYEVNRKERGTYILAYFNCDPLKITGIERDVQLSERILRVMILRTDQMDDVDTDQETPADKVIREAAEAEAAAEAKVQAAIAAAEAEAEAAAETATEDAEPTEEAAAEDVVEAEATEEVADDAEGTVEDAPEGSED